jgi:histone chaperone ASF1
MAAVNVISVVPGNCEAAFTSPFSFTIEYECLYSLESDLEWKMTYVGSAENDSADQLLESVLVGPVQQGNFKFELQGEGPDPHKIKNVSVNPFSICSNYKEVLLTLNGCTSLQEDILGVTVVLLTCSYKGNEFIRIGYYVSNNYRYVYHSSLHLCCLSSSPTSSL